MASSASDPEQRIKELEALLKEQELQDRRSPRAFLSQSFLAALPIVLTVALGFIANHYQSQRQHRQQMEELAKQSGLERAKQASIAKQAQDARDEEAERMYRLQERELAAGAAAAESRFAQEQLTLRSQHAAQQAQQAREFSQSLERQRRQNEADLILQVIRVGDLALARANIEFLLSAGLVRDADGRISTAIVERPPVLPTASGALEVSLPDVQSAQGQQLVTQLADQVAGQAQPERREPLRQLIEAISRERTSYSVRELAAMLALIEDETNGSFASGVQRCTASLARVVARAEPPPGLSEEQCFEFIYGPSSRLGPSLGNREPGDGYRYRGRGYYYITGRARYQQVADEWRTDYVAQPDLLSQPRHAFRAVLTYSERGLRRLRSRPDFAVAPADFPYADAMRDFVRSVTGGLFPGRAERVTVRARAIEQLLRETLPAAAASGPGAQRR